MEDFIKQFLEHAVSVGNKRKLRGVESISARECRVEDRICLNFSANDYLGLSHDPRLREEAERWLRRFGTGAAASRLVTGTLPAYLELEERIAEWKGSDNALLMGSGYLANTGIIAAIADRDTAIFCDRLNHASIYAGCQLSRAKLHRYRHLDYTQLNEQINQAQAKRKLIISDTIFSMDGDVADSCKLREIAERNDAILYLDDAHASGIYGQHGEGLAENATLALSTFSKALGSYGAAISCSSEMREFIINRCGPFIYSTALPPPVCGSVSKAVELVQTDEFCEIRRQLKQKSSILRDNIRKLGFETGNTNSPIIPVILRENDAVMRSSQFLLERGILAVAIRPPTVPKGTARLRLSVNASHTDEDIERVCNAFCELNNTVLTTRHRQ